MITVNKNGCHIVNINVREIFFLVNNVKVEMRRTWRDLCSSKNALETQIIKTAIYLIISFMSKVFIWNRKSGNFMGKQIGIRRSLSRIPGTREKGLHPPPAKAVTSLESECRLNYKIRSTSRGDVRSVCEKKYDWGGANLYILNRHIYFQH